MYSGNLFSRLLAPILLEQTNPETSDETALWQGRKYISFTDNRQGTAKSTFQLNIEVERNWIRTAIYHYLSKERGNTIVLGQTLSEEQRRELALLREHRLNPLRIEELERIQNGQNTPDNPFKTFTEFSTAITGNSELKKLFDHLPGSFRMGRDETAYLKQLVIDQFGRRPLKAGINNPETMGLVRIVYPSIENSRVPDAIQGIFTQLGWTQQDWKDLLKISIDYCIRGDRLVFIPDECKRFKTQAFRSGDIYPSSDRNHNKKWPVLNLNNDDTVKKPHRLVVLLLLAMGIKRENEISPYYENIINQILDAIWNFLRINVLKSNTEEERGYKLDLLGDKVAYQIIDKAWICPVNQVPLDVIFRGYSPLVSSIIASNLEKYKITEPPVEYPYFPFAYRNDKDGNCVDDKTIINWMNENIKKIRAAGLWSNLHERILLHNPVYLSAEHTAQQNKETLRDIEQKFEENRLNILSCSTTMEMGVDISGISEVVMNNVPPKPANYLQRAGRAGRGNETKALAITFCAPDPVGSNLFNNPKWPMTHKTAIPKVSFDSNTLVQRHINSLLLAYYIAADGENDLTVRSLVENFFYPQNGAVNHYQNFLSFLNLLRLGNDAPLLESYQRLVKSTCKTNVVFQDAIASCYASLESIYEQLNGRITLLDNEIESLLNENYQENSPATLSLTSRKKNILRQDVLGFFAEHNFIPSAGIPTGIVEFNTYNIVNYRIDIQNRRNQRDTDEANENNFGYTKSYPSMLLTQAISEYAPGNQIIQNETCYISKGIVMRSQWDNARRVIFQHCPSCGFAKLVDGGRMDRCPDCGNDLQGIRKVAGSFVDFIEPAGYTVDFYTEPTRLITQTKKNYSQPELLNMPKWSAIDDMSSDKMQIRQGGDFSEILYYNLGNGYGYAVCIECGRAVPDISEENRDLVLDRLKMHNHSPIIGGKRRDKDREHCDDDKIKRHVLLGGRFQTDFVEIRLRNENGGLINDEETIYSLGVILTGKLAELIGINSQEISFGVKRYNGYMSIFIFDTAKGGAGYSIRFQELKNDVIDMAQKSLSKCQCKKSCDKCLINRNSQWVIDKLDRKKALEWLNQEISSRQIVPDYIKTQYGDKVKSLNVNLSAELNSVLNNPDLAKATFFINNKLDKWNPDSWEYIKTAKELRHRGIDVCFAFTKPAIDLKTLSASQLTVIGETKITFSLKSFKAKQDDLKPLVLAKYSSSKQLVCYFSERGTLSVAFDDTWATGGISVFKMPVESDLFQFVKWTPDFSFTDNNDKYIMFELRIKTDSTSRQLVNTLTGVETDKWKNIFDKVKNKSVNISYSDIYLNSPLACRLLIDVINGITGKCNFAVNRFDLLLGNVWSERPDDFDSTAERDKYLEEYSSNITCNTTIIKDRQLPHDRTLKFENPNFEFIVRPDGGFENGWTVDYKDKYSGWEDNYESDIKIHNKSVYTGGILYTVLYREK
jgi:hypothetical protein